LSYLISTIKAREILDSRGNPTLEVDVHLQNGIRGRASVPSGNSTGIHEAIELRDGTNRFHGKGLKKAIESVEEEIAPKLKDLDVREQKNIDEVMISLDGTENKRRLGANSILGVSIASAKAAASYEEMELYEYIDENANMLPIPFFNVINGGVHAGNPLDFQEFMIVPIKAETFRDALRMGSETYNTLKNQLEEKYGSNATNLGDEGGFSPPIEKPREALEFLIDAIEKSGYSGQMALAMDVAASTFYQKGEYFVSGEKLTRYELIDFYEGLVEDYPIISIEDPLYEEDFQGFAELTERLSIQIMGDDLFVTNPDRIKRGVEMGSGNAVIWKVNQIGTLTEALHAANLASRSGFAIQVSHRSGDTEDIFISDLSVGIESGQIKSGAPARGERTAKYNRLLRIEERLGEGARFPRSSI
jgi:enolase